MKGVVRTRVGYGGGSSPDPTYNYIGDHSEVIQIDYDPEMISYKDLLEVFWDSHNPFESSWSLQYKKAVFYHNDKQKTIAEDSRDQLASLKKRIIKTQILPFEKFNLAEDYHQKHMLRGEKELIAEFKMIYPTVEELIASTAAARVNGYLGGDGRCDILKTEIHKLGLSEKGMKILLDEVCAGKAGKVCLNNNCS